MKDLLLLAGIIICVPVAGGAIGMTAWLLSLPVIVHYIK